MWSLRFVCHGLGYGWAEGLWGTTGTINKERGRTEVRSGQEIRSEVRYPQ